jgi:hypothetical protein
MTNTLTNLAADLYKAADIVGRELVGFGSSVTINSDVSLRAAKGDTIRSFFTRQPTLNTSYTPAMTIPEGDDQTVDNKTFSLNKIANVKIPYTGEDIKHLNNGAGFSSVYGDQVAQALRKITNQIETDIGTALSQAYSRAIGTAGTTPFASNFNTIAQLRRILVDNGCPMDGENVIVMNTAAGENLRNLAQLQKANEAGSTTLLRQGELLNLQGLSLKESAGVALHTAGSGTSYQTNFPAGYLIGDGAFGSTGTANLTLDTGSGTLLVGDAVTFTGDTNVYGANSTFASNVFTIGETGLRKALADNVALTIGASFTANMAFNRKAVELAMRPIAMPPGGDAAVDSMTVQDPWSGFIYEFRVYKGYGKMMIDITCLYDIKVWKPAYVACLFG